MPVQPASGKVRVEGQKVSKLEGFLRFSGARCDYDILFRTHSNQAVNWYLLLYRV